MDRRHRSQTILCPRQPVAHLAPYCIGQIAIDVRDRKRKTLRMRNRYPGKALCIRMQPAFAFFDDLGTAVDRRIHQLVRLFRGPSQPAGFAKNLNFKTVLPANRNRGCPQTPNGAACHSEIYHGVIFQRSTGNSGRKVG